MVCNMIYINITYLFENDILFYIMNACSHVTTLSGVASFVNKWLNRQIWRQILTCNVDPRTERIYNGREPIT